MDTLRHFLFALICWPIMGAGILYQLVRRHKRYVSSAETFFSGMVVWLVLIALGLLIWLAGHVEVGWR